MKRFLWGALVLACIALGGCALSGSHTKGNSTARGGGNGFSQSDQGTNQATSSTTSIDGGMTTVGGGGQGSASTGPGEAGTGAATAGHGQLLYLYVLFAAAFVVWLIWAIWHRYGRKHGVRYGRRRAASE